MNPRNLITSCRLIAILSQCRRCGAKISTKISTDFLRRAATHWLFGQFSHIGGNVRIGTTIAQISTGQSWSFLLEIEVEGGKHMNAAVRALELPVNSIDRVDEVKDDVRSFQLVTEQQLRRAADQVAQLQSEIDDLRRALAQVKKVRAHQELLLRDTRLREMKLRAILVVRPTQAACLADRPLCERRF
jgi:hypothetical protein